MKIATWNINSLSVRLPQVLDWMAALQAEASVDVLALHEFKLTDDKFPAAAFTDADYHAQWFGQRTYNGARVIGVYFPNGQAPDSDKFVYKMCWLTALREWMRAELITHPKLVLLGDYNITFDDLDVWDPVGLAGTIHCTDDERSHLRTLIDLGLHDSFRQFEQQAKSYSWWDYRMLGFQKNHGMRIDRILVSDALKPRISACAIDRAPRKNPQPTDHAPEMVTLD